MIGGLDSLDSGEITISGRNISRSDKKKMTDYRREDVEFVFQFYNLIPDLTVQENYLIMVVVFRIYSGIEGVLYTPAITAKSITLTIVIVIACYAVSLLIVRRKADRVDMVESLKDNRE